MLSRLRTIDPGWYTARRALRAAVVVPVNFAIGSQLIGDARVATFASIDETSARAVLRGEAYVGETLVMDGEATVRVPRRRRRS